MSKPGLELVVLHKGRSIEDLTADGQDRARAGGRGQPAGLPHVVSEGAPRDNAETLEC